VVRKMRLGTLNASSAQPTGLTDIDRSIHVLQVPLALCQLPRAGLHHRAARPPDWKKQLAAKGFILLGWSDAGWAHFFTKSPVRTPEDMKKLKMFVGLDDDRYDVRTVEDRPGSILCRCLQRKSPLRSRPDWSTAVTSTVHGVVLLQWYRRPANIHVGSQVGG